MDEEEIKALLKDLGLNGYEIRAYLTLTAGGLPPPSKVPNPGYMM